ncbi:unnamed protein product [marine sediment metagenome]|uniref:Uncharacterized protein n=1 Tax=marine sediment metagenome TaxID=412755 RepID=X1PJ77_9ZZZZ
MKDWSVGAEELIHESVYEAHAHKDFLSDRLIQSLRTRRQIFSDHFIGSVLDDAWTVSGDAGFTAYLGESVFTPTTLDVVNSKVRINFNGVYCFRTSWFPKIVAVVRPPWLTDIKFEVTLFRDSDNYIGFRFDSSVSPNWYAVCRNGGVETAEDTGVAATSDFTELKADVETVNIVRFTINGVLKKTIGTNVPSTLLEPQIEVETLTDATKNLLIDSVDLYSDRRP